jgi:SNF2 family DNA or RNA helicase
MEKMNDIVNKKMEKFSILLERANFSMKKYQYDGIEWCLRNELSENLVKGGIVADEMGLGKTLTMIGLMYVNFKRRTLLVVPPVLLEQWAKEIYRCSGHQVLVYHGNKKNKISEEQLRAAPIVLTTYNMLLDMKRNKKNPKEIKENLLKKIVWNRIIFDEAHHLRNKGTERFQGCKSVKGHIRWLISGTPIQNKRQDFYNLCEMIGIDKKGKNDIPIIIRNHILRRTKADVGIELPPILKEDCIVPWKNKYEKMLSEELHSMLPKQTNVIGVKSYLLDQLDQRENTSTLLSILRARQSCILPSLMLRQMMPYICDIVNSETEPEEVTRTDMIKIYEQAFKSSSKLDAVVKCIVDRKDNGNGKIIFCHFRNEIDLIASRLIASGLKKVVTYDGRNSNTAKGLQVLTEAADVIILQIQTGCEGLNLQEHFSEIYFVSPHWNPCVEDQAVARCHRIGQQKPTYVFKFVMSGFNKTNNNNNNNNNKPNPENEAEEETEEPITLEKYVDKVQNTKREIINEIISCV